MPRLNILRPHRRANSSTTTVTPAQTAAAVPPSASPPSNVKPALSALPPLDIPSPNLDSLQWFETSVFTAASPAAATSSATDSTPGDASSTFSRTSTPYTAATSEPPLRSPPLRSPPLRPPPLRSPPSPPTAPPPPPPLQPATARHVRPASRPPARIPSVPPKAAPTVVHSEKHEKVKGSRKEKLNRLNPMNRLLRRRSSQTQLDNRSPTLPDDFDPGIIYGTRHPDWSSHPKRVEGDGRSFSPVPIGPGSPVFPPGTDGKRKNSEDRTSIGARIGSAPTSPAAAPLGLTLPSPVSSITPATPLEPEPTEPEETSAPPSRRGVTLVDHPLALPHHHVVNASRFSFEGSSNAPSASASVAPSIKIRDPDDASIDEGFDLDLDDDVEDDGFARANEGIFLHPSGQKELEQMEEPDVVNPPEQDQYTALQAAVEAMNLTMPESSSFGIEELPSMDPQPSVIANPRGLDLSDSDFEFIDSPSELMAYEAEDDDLYYDDGIIDELAPPPQQPDPSPPTPEVDPRISLLPQDGSPTSPSPDPTAFPPFINPIGGGLGCTQQKAQFYAPPPPLLTQLLRQYQQQQLTISTTSLPSPVPPSPIYPSSDSYDYDGFDDGLDDGPGDDLDLVEAANADALASDSEFYRSEFGTGFFFSPSSYHKQHHHGGDTALTPISERSEGGSYRNSLVVGNYGDLAKGEEEKEIGELLRRREAWGTTGGGGGDGGGEWETVAVAAGGVSPGGGVGLGEVAEEEAYEGVEIALREMEDPPQRPPPPPPGLMHPGGRGMVPTKGSFEEGALGGV